MGVLALMTRALVAQGVVSGQVSVLERPGDVTEDLGDVVVILEPVGGYHGRVSPTNAVIALARTPILTAGARGNGWQQD